MRLGRPVGDRLELTGAYLYSHADLGFDLSRLQVGTSDVPAFSGTARTAGGGDATLDTHVADLAARLSASEQVHLNLGYRFNERSQNGRLDETTSLGALAATTGDQVRVHSVDGDVEVDPRADLSLTLWVPL